ncbi:hypothetical protein RAE19_04290 [Rhodoferax sp. TBRC 17660]|uniref:Uncharacterized protein n=1 Tax=Rhodoferax potami TaxID=3068338 RepID=A0ABU3KKR5_9BURK|nr:hypothetical protein [Rhodoferax sp. TBRC 17660]MDT7517963.1 hypothetical protein [Rhodoferax sp. TBRC 17660]
MTRPLGRLGIAELEELFKKPNATADEIKALETELTYRSTAKAEKLLSEIRSGGRYKQAIASAGKRIAEKQLVQLELPSVDGFELSSSAANPSVQLVNRPSSPASIPTPTPQKMTNAKPVLAMSKEQAFKILKVSPTASWEQLEKSRRELVASGQPDKLAGMAPDVRQSIQEECKQVNAAYKFLLQGS